MMQKGLSPRGMFQFLYSGGDGSTSQSQMFARRDVVNAQYAYGNEDFALESQVLNCVAAIIANDEEKKPRDGTSVIGGHVKWTLTEIRDRD